MRTGFRLFREPLVTFTVVAAFVFALHEIATDDGAQEIAIPAQAVEAAVDQRVALLGRRLTGPERAQLVSKLVTEEILVREAVARGFHMHDSKTRARLVTQMHFVLAEEAPQPDAAELEALREADPQRYMTPETVTFDHIFFESSQQAARELMDQISAGNPVPKDAGDRFWLGSRMEYYSPPQLVAVLGKQFAGKLVKLKQSEWAGPIQSGRGWHLVKLAGFNPPQPLPDHLLERKLVEDWKAAYRSRTFEDQIKQMSTGYRISLPEVDSGETQKNRNIQLSQMDAAPEESWPDRVWTLR